MKLLLSLLIITILVNCCFSVNIKFEGETSTESPSSYVTFVPYGQDSKCSEVSGVGFGFLKGQQQTSIYYPYDKQVALCSNVTLSGSTYKLTYSGDDDCQYGQYFSEESFKIGVCTYSKQLGSYMKVTSNFNPPSDTLLMNLYTQEGSFGPYCSVYNKEFYNFITNGTVLSNVQDPASPSYVKQVYYCSDSQPYNLNCESDNNCSTNEITGCNYARLKTTCSK